MSSKWYACSDQKYYLETHDLSSKIHPGNASQHCLDDTMDNVKPKSPGLRHDSSSVSPREKSQQKSGNTIFPAFLHFLMRNGSNPHLTRKRHSKNACRDQNYYLETGLPKCFKSLPYADETLNNACRHKNYLVTTERQPRHRFLVTT